MTPSPDHGQAKILRDADGPAASALAVFNESLASGASNEPALLREALGRATQHLEALFKNHHSVDDLVRARADVVDELLGSLWRRHASDVEAKASLLAVGGYGRGELHPGSDIDVMVLLDDQKLAGDWISDFLTSLWDSGLEIGHSVRTVSDCEHEAKADVTVMTTLMESRLLAGNADLHQAMDHALATSQMWDSAAFFEAKRQEQVARHARYHDTAYNLEPNVKGSPGGLRDIQLIGWIAMRHFGARTFAELVEHKFLTPGQLRLLMDGRSFLWRVRYALHVITGRREDRLLFDHQIKIAELLGYEDATFTLAVEQLMQRYYRTVMNLSRINEMLLQLFEEAILMDPSAAPVAINERFQVKNGYLQTCHDNVFKNDPSALLEVFLLLQQNPDINGVSAWTVGLIKRNLNLIDEEFRQNPRNHRLFLQILRAPAGVTHELRRMNLYGVLGLYIPSFGRIVGRMQYDLFHAYTVDEHTLFVVSNLRRFALERFDNEYPHCSRVMQGLEKPEIVYLGGLFHDIAKGRGGDHSTLGAVDAEAFCLEHGLSRYDARLVAWLVQNHLILSMTAQKMDLSDPDVIHEFANNVGDQAHLDCLYVLTVADVRGTNPKLWNSWKAQLFRDLYELTTRALRRGLENPIDKDELIASTKQYATSNLNDSAIDAKILARFWEKLPDQYFLRYNAGEIAWHCEEILAVDPHAVTPLLAVRREKKIGAIAVFLYSSQEQRTFAHTTAMLDELGLNILDARIVPTRHGFSIDSYLITESTHADGGQLIRLDDLRRRLAPIVADSADWRPKVTRRAPRQVRMFNTETRVRFASDPQNRYTIMELVTGDRPGLLMTVGNAFIEHAIDIDTAKILTIGERAEDVFFITDEQKNPLSAESCDQLGALLQSRLNEQKTS